MSHVDTSGITHVSLCSGYGGIDLGLRGAVGESLRTVAYAEVEAFAIEVLLARMAGGQLDAAPLWTDLRTFPWRKFHGLVDILSGGYPCQPFSAAGKRLGHEDPRHLWPAIAAGIAAMRPRLCFFENVEGHISLGLRDVLHDLVKLGYHATWGIFSAAEVGAPHQRKRVFVMAHDASQRIQGCGAGWLQETRPHAGQGLLVRESDAGSAWPSRPGEPQHAWEPPRVLVNSHTVAAGGVAGTIQSMANTSGDRQHRRGQPQPRGEQGARRDESNGCGQWRAEGKDLGHTAQHDRRDLAGWCGARGPQLARGREIEPSLGGDADGSPARVDLSDHTGLSHSELDEIRSWMHRVDNRTDELRLLGNGVVPATAERAFRTLIGELLK